MPSGHRRSSAKSALNRSPNQRLSMTSTSARHQTNTYPSSRSHQHRRSTLSVDTDTDDDETMHRRFIAVRDNRQLHPGKIDARIPSISSSQRGANEADCASKSDNLMRVKKDAPGGKVNHTETRPKSKGRRGSAVLSDGEQEADPFDAWFDPYNRLMYGEKEAVDVESTNEVAAMPTGGTQLQDDLRRLSLASLDSLTPRRSSDCQHPPQNLMTLTDPLESCPPRQSQQYDSLRRNAESIQRMADTDNSLSTKSRRNLNSSIGNGVKAVKRIIKRKSADLKRRSTGGNPPVKVMRGEIQTLSQQPPRLRPCRYFKSNNSPEDTHRTTSRPFKARYLNFQQVLDVTLPVLYQMPLLMLLPQQLNHLRATNLWAVRSHWMTAMIQSSRVKTAGTTRLFRWV